MHRNIKLENLFLDETGYLKIVDFSQAKPMSGNETSYDLYGTSAHFAPEILKGNGYSYSADWWAVGIIMYEMLVGVKPFIDKNESQLKRQIINGQTKLPNQVRVPHSDDFADLIHKLL